MVLLALADDDHAAHGDRVDQFAHRVDGGPVAALLVAAAHPAAGGHGTGLGDPYQLERQVAVWSFTAWPSLRRASAGGGGRPVALNCHGC